ncbi:hypothetical protein CEUSTIGMA_g5303.t1 [Chlamydomonas eustigma]|uniref:t-SNARE coiled-coil homology domain-containing protein n=1 Tax=Chlamydomonas eustigma TaxID=1157962 RepID=A0A250X471_9CHLO|nr:hypothetical protein CEUSTIGMA_g5303.t1 [Chlamydomonas eustigma]|eukprot:GAX77861.1 hypothetical protein CEUSTIGMA_g5303.t1 [Chlamydomonas eustigma]
MTIFDLTERSTLILKKYEKYDSDLKKKGTSSASDPFTEELEELEAEVNKLMVIAGEVALETNRTAIAAKNAEIRRVKNVMLTDAIDSVSKKVKKGKGINKEIIKDRNQKVQDLIDKIYAIPDGMSGGQNKRPSRYNKFDKKGKQATVMLDLENNVGQHLENNPLYWQENEQTQQFEKTWETRKLKQDAQLDRIGNTVETLGELARGMGDALDRQAPVLDDVEAQINKVTATIKTNNVKLKGIVHKMANARNFCMDVVLIIILLAIGGYLYSVFK